MREPSRDPWCLYVVSLQRVNLVYAGFFKDLQKNAAAH